MKKEELRTCNLDYLYDLAKGDRPFIREMITVFLEEIVPELTRMKALIEATDFSSIKQLAHKLRSSIPYLGLDVKIGEDLSEMEDLAREQVDMEKIQTRFKKVQVVCDAAVKELLHLEV